MKTAQPDRCRRYVGPMMLLAAVAILGCSASPESTNDRAGQTTSPTDKQPADIAPIDLLADERLEFWEAAKFGGQGEFAVSSEKIELGFGYMMTGVVYKGEIPTDHYRVSYQARKTQGSDFFGTVTFPVKESHCSLILGGWGGATVGLSCLDDEDASQNETRKIIALDENRWHQVVVEVTHPLVKCWINDELLVDVDVSGRKVSVRGDVRVCRPLGFCSFETECEIKNVTLELLKSSKKDTE